MIKIHPSQYRDYVTFAYMCQEGSVYPLSIAEEYQTGDIYVDSIYNTSCVLFWHACGFAFLSGVPSDMFLEEIFEHFYLADLHRRFVLISQNDAIISFFRNKTNLTSGKRIHYSYARDDRKKFYLKDENYTIKKITKRILSRIDGNIVPSFFWKNDEEFMKNGFGYCVQYKDKIAAIAFSAAISSKEIDIGVETMDEFRRQGLSTVLANRMCKEILLKGKRPVWGHSAMNTGSMKTAKKVGFEVVNECDVIIM